MRGAIVLAALLGAAATACLAEPATFDTMQLRVATPPVAPPEPAKLDLAFAAFQRGLYVTAFKEAMKRLDADKADAAAMTLIAELYAHGNGARLDVAEAARWYRLAANLGNREAQFALALLTIQGRGVAKERPAARALFEAAAASGHAGAWYNLGVMDIEGGVETAKPDFAAAAAAFQKAVDLGEPEAAYALALLYREGKGVAADPVRAAELLGVAAREKNTAAEVDLAIMLFNGDEAAKDGAPEKKGSGIPKDEAAAAKLLLAAAARDNAVAQNRVARLLAVGRGLPKNEIEACKWHILARAQGIGDAFLDGVLYALSAEDKAKAETAVRRYTGS